MAMSIEERRQRDKERKAKKYRENPDKAREAGLAFYYKKKEKDPEFHCKPVGRPRAVARKVNASEEIVEA